MRSEALLFLFLLIFLAEQLLFADANKAADEKFRRQLQDEANCLSRCGIADDSFSGQLSEDTFVGEDENYRVMGGNPAPVHSHPWVVLIEMTVECTNISITFTCTGTIVGKSTVVTAAHCLLYESAKVGCFQEIKRVMDVGKWIKVKTTSVKIYANLKNRNSVTWDDVYLIEGYTFDPLFNVETFDMERINLHDIALLHLKESKKFVFGNGDIRRVCLPSQIPNEHVAGGSLFMLVGWGNIQENETMATSTTVLREAAIQIEDKRYCASHFNNNGFNPQFHFCASRRNRGGLSGDSGAPALVNIGGRWYMIGIFTNYMTSTIWKNVRPDIYLRTATQTFCNWISTKTYQTVVGQSEVKCEVSTVLPISQNCQEVLLNRKNRLHEIICGQRLNQEADPCKKAKKASSALASNSIGLELQDELEAKFNYINRTKLERRKCFGCQPESCSNGTCISSVCAMMGFESCNYIPVETGEYCERHCVSPVNSTCFHYKNFPVHKTIPAFYLNYNNPNDTFGNSRLHQMKYHSEGEICGVIYDSYCNAEGKCTRFKRTQKRRNVNPSTYNVSKKLMIADEQFPSYFWLLVCVLFMIAGILIIATKFSRGTLAVDVRDPLVNGDND